jgi:putative spermidine/putrescine transport system ATP-binding protein
VTHTQPEAIALADMVVVMDTGRIDQADSAEVVFNRPRTPYVAHFMGGQNVLTGTVEGSKDGLVRLKTASGATLEAQVDGPIAAPGLPLSVSVRRDRIQLHKRDSAADPPGTNEIAGFVTATEYQGSYVKVTLDVAGGEFVANVSDGDYFAAPVRAGDPVTARWNASDIHVLAKADAGASVNPYGDKAA